ncbi:hypothetical protein TRFO_31656 [Tritrichomonas foetus]|uniref:Uncharacterized protein n=1 Tax=Tritrichomonas foetus TaxID=1144522 RepID=A0A1J4JRX2_9EUKA|nr:hypothetical protein TRFO_31656 [Tritrichomonas foetus]|eukprot:OHT01506.1 hypothetical protein TRFO_31656 [Tritrichomonas foetus]
MSVSSTVVSFFTYFQNIGCTISLPSIEVPEQMRVFLDCVRNFLAFIQSMIPAIPPFDLRMQLVIMTVGFPLILDILFVWFVQPLLTTIFHVIDLGAMFCLFMFLSQGILDRWSVINYIVVVFTSIWTLIRLIMVMRKGCSGSCELVSIARNVCNHFLHGFVPNIEIRSTLNDLNHAIERFSKVVEIKPKPPSVFSSVTLFMVASLLLIFALWCLEIIPIPLNLPEMIKIIFPWVAIVFSAIFYISFFLKFFECGRRFGMLLKQFCKRWGLRLLMLALELLYLPILTLTVSNIIFSSDLSCDYGYYRKLNHSNYDSSLDLIVHHDSQCVKCEYNNPNDICEQMCFTQKELRLTDDPSLRLFEDVFKVSGGFIIYVALFVMIGIPVLWYYIIQRNISFTFNINVYGHNPEEKWRRLVNRMKTTGIFLFVNYKFNTSKWSVFYLGVKFFVMIITTIAGRIYPYVVFILPFFYIVVLSCIIYYRPYLYTFNNILDSILYFVQSVFSSIPVFSLFGIILPEVATIPMSILILVIPIVSILFLLLFRSKTVDFANDPTYPEELTEEEEEELERKRRHAKRKLRRANKAKTAHKKQKNKNADLSDSDDPFILGSRKKKIYPADEPEPQPNNPPNKQLYTSQNLDDAPDDSEGNMLLEELDENDNVCLIKEDEAELTMSEIATVKEAITTLKMNKWSSESEMETEKKFSVNKRILSSRMTSMYEMLDVIVDGSTIDFLTTILNIGISFSIAALGWFVGALFLTNNYQQIVCDKY